MNHGFGNVQLVEYQNQSADKKSWEAHFFNQIIFLIIWLKNIECIFYMEQIIIKQLQNSGADVSGPRKPLPDILSYQQAVRLVLDISAQLSKLHENMLGFIDISKEQIEMIGNNSFILKNPNLYRVKRNGEILISKPFTYNNVMAPELKTINTLPEIVNSNVGYYCLCKLVLSLLNIDNNLDRLRPTKLYFLMERILKENPLERRFIYI